jgi:hypothetical protein
VDTLEFFPHNYQMPQLSSTDRLIMAANDMKDALQKPHPEVPFKLKLWNNQTPTLPAEPPKVTLRTCSVESSNPILASPIPPPRHKRSRTIIHARDITNAPLLPRVVTPMTRNPSPLRAPTRSRNLSPRSLTQDDFCGMDTDHMSIALENHHWSQQHLANAVIHPVTGK